jgi:hypothetical protein
MAYLTFEGMIMLPQQIRSGSLKMYDRSSAGS